MLKVRKEAQIFIDTVIVEQFKRNPFKTHQVVDAIRSVRGSEIAHEIIDDKLMIMYKTGILDYDKVKRTRNNGKPYSDNSEVTMWKVIDFEGFEKKYRKSINNPYIEIILRRE